MSFWARDVLSRLFSTKSRSRATSDTTSNKSRAKTAATKEDQQQTTRRSSLATAATFLRNGPTRAGDNNNVKDAPMHRRGGSQPVNASRKIARLCHTRSQTQVQPGPRLQEDFDDTAEHRSEQIGRFSTDTAECVQAATRCALEQVGTASFLEHDPTIEWEPPTWDDLWRDQGQSERTYSNIRRSAFAHMPRKPHGDDDSGTRFGTRNRSVSRKSSFDNLRSSVQSHRDSRSSDAEANDLKSGHSVTRPQHVKRSSLYKKLPQVPMEPPPDPARLPPRYLEENAARNARILRSLQDDGILNLDNTEETHRAVVWAPAVTHERRVIQPIEVFQRAVSRDVHNHHIIHRVLPVVDLQVLPTRHFMPDGQGGYAEISEEEIPGGRPDRLDELIAGAISKSPTRHEGGMPTLKLSSQPLEDKSRRTGQVSQAGRVQTEQWWLHSPDITAPVPRDHSEPGVMPRKTVCPQNSRYGQFTGLDHAKASLPQERAQQQSFQYRTPDGLPSWTAITAETQLPPPSDAHDSGAAAAAASAKLATPPSRPQPMHISPPLHVAYRDANATL